MSNLRSKLIRVAYQNPELRTSILPLLSPQNEKWKKAEGDARLATIAALPPCRCMGPTATILDQGRGPILDVSYGHDITPEEIRLMDRAVSELGWRGWAYGDRGIAFKPTSVDLGEGY